MYLWWKVKTVTEIVSTFSHLISLRILGFAVGCGEERTPANNEIIRITNLTKLDFMVMCY